MDGTILDTIEDLADAVNVALEKNGFPLHTVDEVRFMVGNGIKKLVQRACPEGSDAVTLARVYNDFTEHYSVHCEDKTRPYPGIVSLLQNLKAQGYKTAVVTNKDDYAAKILVEKYFKGLFDASMGAREGFQIKPAPDEVNEVLRLLNCSKKDAVYIGDSDVDIMTAKNSELDCICVSWGFRSIPFLKEHGAKVIVNNEKELLEKINENN